MDVLIPGPPDETQSNKEEVSMTTPLSSIPAAQQIARVLEAAEGTCIRSHMINDFLQNFDSVAGTDPVLAAEAITQFIRVRGKKFGYSETDINDFLKKIGASTGPYKALINVTFQIEVEGKDGFTFNNNGADGGVVYKINKVIRDVSTDYAKVKTSTWKNLSVDPH